MMKGISVRVRLFNNLRSRFITICSITKFTTYVLSYAQIGDPSNVQFLEGTDGSHVLFKGNGQSDEVVKKRETSTKKLVKRASVTLSDGKVIDDRVIVSNSFDFDGLAPAFQANLNKMLDIEADIKEHDCEPAEGEVQAVLSLCSTCYVESFEGAVVLAWKNGKVIYI